jgi:hypothetical protein
MQCGDLSGQLRDSKSLNRKLHEQIRHINEEKLRIIQERDKALADMYEAYAKLRTIAK